MALNIDALVTPNSSTYGNMSQGQWLTSSNGYYILKFMSNGDVIGYHRFTGDGFWSASSSGPRSPDWFFYTGANKLSLQTDGNLVTYNGGSATWATSLLTTFNSGYKANRNKNYKTVMQADGNIVTYEQASGIIMWASSTGTYYGASPRNPAPPGAPTITNAINITDTSITIVVTPGSNCTDWSNGTALPLKYSVTCLTTNIRQDSDTPSIIFNGLSSNTEYNFVASVTTSGKDPQTNNSALYPSISSNNSATYKAKTIVITLPEITNLTFDPATLLQNSVNIRFTPPIYNNQRTNIDSYNVYSGTTLLTNIPNQAGPSYIGTVMIPITRCDYYECYTIFAPTNRQMPESITLPLTNLLAGKNYTNINVTSVVSGKESRPSNAISFQTLPGVPSAPTNLTASNLKKDEVTISFTAPTGVAIDYYNIITGGATIGATTTTSFTVTGLTPNTNYTYVVEARSGGNKSTPSSPLSIVTLPLPPNSPNYITNTPTSSSVSITFSASPGANVTSYNVYSGSNVVGTGTTSPILVTNLSPSTQYSFALVATNNGGDSQRAGPIICKTLPIAPTAPTNLSFSNATLNSIVLTFKPPTEEVTSYLLYLGGAPTTTQITASPYSITNLSPNTQYSLTLVAQNSAGSSPQSAPVIATTKSAPPTNINVTNINEISATITATPSGTLGISGYKIYINGSSTEYATAQSFPYILNDLKQNTKYSFTITSVNSAGESAQSSTATFTTLAHVPSAATNLRSQYVTSTSMMIYYNQSPDPADNYSLYSGSTLLQSSPSPLPFDIKNLTPNTKYTFTILCSNAGSQSVASNALTVTTLPSLPGNITSLAGSAIKADGITLTFPQPSGVINGYYVYSCNTLIQTFNTTATSLLVNSLTPNSKQFLTVIPFNLAGTAIAINTLPSMYNLYGYGAQTGTSFTINGIIYFPFTTLPQFPPVPSINNIVATSTSINISLDRYCPSYSQINSFTIYNSGKKLKEVTEINVTPEGLYAATVTIDSLTPNTLYNITATSSNVAGESPSSDIRTVTTLPPAPAVLTGVKVLSVTQTTISVSFIPPAASDAVSGYLSSIGWGTGTASNFIIQNLAPGTDYTFTISSVNATGTSPPSSQLSAKTLPNAPSVPTRLTCGGSTANSIIVSFNAPAGPVDSYTIYSANTAYGPFMSNNVNVSNGMSQILVQNLNPGTTYSFTIIASNAGGNSGSSTALSCSTERIATTTRAPVTTTQTPVTTTQTPVTTTQTPVTTTQTPVTTTRAPFMTTQAPVTTNWSSYTTTQPPVNTTNWSSYTTTQTPVNTTNLSSYTTTQTPVNTTRAPVTTTQSANYPAMITTASPSYSTTNFQRVTTYSPSVTSGAVTQAPLSTSYAPVGSLNTTYGSYSTTSSFKTTLPSKITTSFSPIILSNSTTAPRTTTQTPLHTTTKAAVRTTTKVSVPTTIKAAVPAPVPAKVAAPVPAKVAAPAPAKVAAPAPAKVAAPAPAKVAAPAPAKVAAPVPAKVAAPAPAKVAAPAPAKVAAPAPVKK